MLYGNNCYIFIEYFPQKFSPCIDRMDWVSINANFRYPPLRILHSTLPGNSIAFYHCDGCCWVGRYENYVKRRADARADVIKLPWIIPLDHSLCCEASLYRIQRLTGFAIYDLVSTGSYRVIPRESSTWHRSRIKFNYSKHWVSIAPFLIAFDRFIPLCHRLSVRNLCPAYYVNCCAPRYGRILPENHIIKNALQSDMTFSNFFKSKYCGILELSHFIVQFVDRNGWGSKFGRKMSYSIILFSTFLFIF